MKLKLETPVKELSELEISAQQILLFSKYAKSMYLIVDVLGFRLAVKSKNEWKYFDNDKKEDAQKYYNSLYTIPKEETAAFESFKSIISKMEQGVCYEIDFRGFGGICVDSHTKGGSDYYWALYDKRGIFNRYPMKSNNIIKSWKTLDGAKKDLTNKIKSFF